MIPDFSYRGNDSRCSTETALHKVRNFRETNLSFFYRNMQDMLRYVDKEGKLVIPKSDSILPSITRRSLIYEKNIGSTGFFHKLSLGRIEIYVFRETFFLCNFVGMKTHRIV